MAFNALRLEYTLEGRSKYITWKDRIEAMLEYNVLMDFIDSDVPKPGSSDVAFLDAWQKKTTKTRRILSEGVKDHIVSGIHGKATPFLIWKAFTYLFQSRSD